MTTTVVVGNPEPRSHTLHAATHVVEALTGRAPDAVIDLVDLGAALLEWDALEVDDAVREVRASDLVVVASPTHRASYTGLLKLFLDRFAVGSLVGTVAIPLMLGSDLRHSLAPETFLKPVLAEIGASTPTRGLFLLDSEWAESDALTVWLEAARQQLPAHVLAAAGG